MLMCASITQVTIGKNKDVILEIRNFMLK